MAVDRETALELMATRRFVPYHYNRDSRTFHFGEEVRRFGEVPLSGALHQEGREQGGEAAQKLISRVAFASSFNKIHSLPLADTFFGEMWTSDLLDETREVMRDVYIAVDKDFPAPNRPSSIPEKNKFMTHLYEQKDDPSGHAGVFLQTHGICACTKPEDRVDTAFYPIEVLGYREHNVETPAERTSLLAGLGHIARRANEYVR